MIDQQTKSGRPMDCPFITLANEYKAIYDAAPGPGQRIKAENDFRKALMLLPEFKPDHSRMILHYLFTNPGNYTPAQKALIVKDHVEYLIAKITPENEKSTIAFLRTLLPDKKRAGKLEGHPAVAALIQNKLDTL